MLMDRERRISCRNGTFKTSKGKFRDENGYGFVNRSEGCRERSPSRSPDSKFRITSPSSSPPSMSSSYSTAAGFIEHRVSKYDTLAGVAIKYGVEVADITKLNGLVTDLQMFALKSLRIPLPGRHPPSPCLSNCSLNHGEDCSELASSSSAGHINQDISESFQSLRLKPPETKVSPAMNSLQGYYGLKPKNRRASEGFDMTIYKQKASSNQQDNDQYLTPIPVTNTPLTHHRKSRSLVDALYEEINQSAPSEPEEINPDIWTDKLTKRRQKSEANFTSRPPELLLKEENRISTGFSAITGKCLALRSKATSKTNLSTDKETTPINLMDAPVGDNFSGFRKSSSASSLQDSDTNNNNSSLWPTTKWTLKPELLTQAAMSGSIFDGLPMPLSGRRNKTAVD